MAERFSRFRDPGTGIQVFLPPIPSAGSSSPAALLVLAPFAILFGIVRVALLLVFALLWTLVALPLELSGGSRTSLIHFFFGRTILFLIGFSWISPEIVSLKGRGRASHGNISKSSFQPRKGDVILSNWSSWVDVLFLFTQFNATFVRPIVTANKETKAPTQSPAARRKDAASRGQQFGKVQSQSTPNGSVSGAQRLLGWQQTSFLGMMMQAGKCPEDNPMASYRSLDVLLKSAQGPVVVFPELVTSNNRGLLRFEAIFPSSWDSLYKATGALRIGAGQSNIFLLSLKHDPPTLASPSSTYSVPSAHFSPLPHALRLCFSPSLLGGYSLQARFLAGEESPSHANFVTDVQSVKTQKGDSLSEKCADLISSLSRLKRTGVDWQEKEAFLSMYHRKA